MKFRSCKRPFSFHDLEQASLYTRFLLFSLVAVIFLLFCVGTVFFIAFLVAHPRPPLWDLTHVTITKFRVGNSSSPRSSLLLDVDISLNMSARNCVERDLVLWYEPTIVEAFVFQQLGGQDIIPAFSQEPQQTDERQAIIRGRDLNISGELEAAKLQDIINNTTQSVDVHIDVYVRAKVRILDFLHHHYKVRLQCDASVSSPQAGTESSLISKVCEEEKQWLSRS